MHLPPNVNYNRGRCPGASILEEALGFYILGVETLSFEMTAEIQDIKTRKKQRKRMFEESTAIFATQYKIKWMRSGHDTPRLNR